MDGVSTARGSAVLLLLEQASAPRADQQLLSSQALLHYATSHNTAVRKIALQKIERLSEFLVTYLGKVRCQEPFSQPVSPSLHSRASCSSGVPVQQARAQVGASAQLCPEARVFVPPLPLLFLPQALLSAST